MQKKKQPEWQQQADEGEELPVFSGVDEAPELDQPAAVSEPEKQQQQQIQMDIGDFLSVKAGFNHVFGDECM